MWRLTINTNEPLWTSFLNGSEVEENSVVSGFSRSILSTTFTLNGEHDGNIASFVNRRLNDALKIFLQTKSTSLS